MTFLEPSGDHLWWPRVVRYVYILAAVDSWRVHRSIYSFSVYFFPFVLTPGEPLFTIKISWLFQAILD